MTTLQQHLTRLPYRDLRGVATRLNVRQPGQHQKSFWITAIHSGWHTPATAQRWLAQLSPTAHTALQRLRPLHQLPLPLFVAQFGNLRRLTHQQRWPTPPWQAPQTVAEELYYSGLLVPGPAPLWHKATFVSLPTDLRPLLAEADTVTRALGLVEGRRQGDKGTRRQGDRVTRRQGDKVIGGDPLTTDSLTTGSLTTGSLTTGSLTTGSLTTDSLTHDLAQLLIYLHSQAALGAAQPCTHQGRWLAPRHLQPLNQRLLQPEPAPLPRSHKQTERLRLLFFLANAAGWLAHGALTPLAWAWLACSPAQQLRQLWQAWQQASADLRTVYHQPDADLPPPWPHLLLAQLAHTTSLFTATDLANALLAQTDHHAWLVAHLADLSTLDQLVADLLADSLYALGVVATSRSPLAKQQTPPLEQPYTLTASGAWLLQRTDGLAPTALLPVAPLATTSLQVDGDRWQVTVPASNNATLGGQAHLATYAHYQPQPLAQPVTIHTYQLTATTVARAAAAGHGLATLFAAFTHLDIGLPPPQIEQLHGWHAQGHQLTLEHLLVLRSQQPAQLAALYQHPALRTLLGEPLTPTLCVVPADPATILTHLRRAGFHPAAVGEPVEPTASSPDAEPVEADATNPLNEDPVPPPNWGRLGGGGGGSGALWLAGQIYALLGDHLALPIPAPHTTLAALFQQVSPAEQAVLEAQRQQLHEDLLTLLDGLPLIPPPHPQRPRTMAQPTRTGQPCPSHPHPHLFQRRAQPAHPPPGAALLA